MNNIKLFTLFLVVSLSASAFAGDSVPLFLPFQGRATDTSGQPIVSPPNLTIKFRIYPAAGACYIYEDTQSVATNGYGFFSVILGGLGNRTGPANNFADVFNNDVAVADSCAGTFDGAANEWRRLEVVVDGVALPTMQTIAASAFSINSNMLDGRTSAGYIQVNGAVSQANMSTLVGAGDASALHHHDSRYVTLSGNNSISGNITSTGSFYGVGAGSTIGIGTSSPIADIEIRRANPSVLLGATSGSGGTPSITFTSGATQRARIQASESTNEMRFYTGSTEAMRLDASQNLILTGSLQVGGTVGLGKYNNAQETTLITALTGMGAAAVGTMWVNSQTNTFKFWDGTQAIGLGSASYITSVTAGTGLTNSGTAQAPILNVAYGSASGTAIQGNAVFAGDVTGAYTNLVVTGLQGRSVDSAAPTAGQVLTWNTSVSRWMAQTIQDTQLSSNVALKNAANVFTNTNSIQVPTTTNVGLVLQTTDNNTTNSLLSIRNQAGTPIATVRADAVPTAGTDLTTKSYVDTLAGTKLNLSGGTMTGALNMGGFQITNLADPTAAQHAVTRAYADGNLGGRTLASTAPVANQILKWNGSQWEPTADVDTGITALTGDVSASGNGSVAAVIADSAVTSAKIADGTIATADIGNSQVTDAKIVGVAVGKITSAAGQYFTYAPNNSACGNNEVLKWNGSAWICGADNNAGGTVTLVSGGTGLLGGNITGTGTLSVNVGTGANQIVQLNGTSQIPAVDGSLLTFINAATLRGVNLSATAPTSGQVLKYNGSAWEAAADTDTGITALSGDVTASGSGSVAATIRDDRILSRMLDSGAIGLNRIVMTDGTTGNTLTYADGCSAGQVLKWVDSTNGWACAADAGAAGVVTLVAGGTGTTGGSITTTGTINVDVGTGANQIVQLNGSSQIPAVDGSLLTSINAATLRGVNLSATAPTSGYVLKYNGSAWEAAPDSDQGGDITMVQTSSPLLGGGASGGLTLSIDVGTGANQVVQLDGSSRIPAVNGSLLTNINAATLRGVNLSTNAPASGQVLKYNGSAWEAAADNNDGGDVTAIVAGTGITGGGIFGDVTVGVDVGTGANQIVQLDGSSRIPAVNGSLLTNINAATLRGNNISTTAPTSGQVLAWNGSAWAPASDGGGTVTLVSGGTGLLGGNITGTGTLSVNVGTGANQIVQLNGSSQIPAVDGSLLTFINAATLRGVNLSATAPTSGQVLKYNGSAWEAAADTDTGITALSGDVTASGSGSVAATIRDDRILSRMLDSGAIGLNRIVMTDGTTGNTLTYADGCSAGQVLKWVDSTNGWACAADAGAAGVVTLVAGGTGTTGGSITTTGTINVDVGTGANQIVQLNGSSQIPAVDGSLLTFVNAATLRGVNLSATAPTSGYVLKYNGSAWEAAPDSDQGGDITMVQTASPLLGGGASGGLTLSIDVGTGANQVVQLNGSSQIPAVDGSLLTSINAATLRGVNLSATAPTSGYVLKYNGSAWEAAADSDAGGTVTLVSGGTGLTGGNITGTGTLAVNVGTGANQIVQLNGTSQIPAVDGSLLTFINAATLRGVNLSATAPTSGQVLKYNGSAWEAAADTDTGITALSGDVTASGSGSVAATIRDDRILSRMLDSGSIGLNRIVMTDGTTGNTLTYADGCAAGQVLKWVDSTNGWACAADAGAAGVVTLVAGGTGTTGGSITTTGTINVDVGTGANQIVQLDGSSRIPAVNGSLLTNINAATLRGVNLSATAPTSGYVLKYNGSAWEAAAAPATGVTLVAGGTGTTGGSISTTGTINVDVGTGANQIVQLDGSSRIPAVNGSLLTNINAATLRGVNLSATAPTSGYVLKYNGSAWEAAADSDAGGTVTLVSGGTGLTGGNITGTGTLAVNVGTGANQIVQLNGSSQIPAVDGSLLTFINAATIRGVNVSTTAPTSGQILTYNGSAWEAAAAPVSGITALSGDVTATGSGSVAATIRDDRILSRMLDSGAIGLNRIVMTDGTTGNGLTYADGCSAGQVLKWVDSTNGWACAADAGAAGVVTLVAGGTGTTGGSITSTGTINVDVGTGANQIVQLNGSSQIPAVDGSLLTSINAATIRGVNVSTTAPTSGQILTYNGSAWEAAAAPSTGVTLVAGGTGTTGGSISTTGTINVDVGTGANQIVQLNGSSQIPAVDGSLLTSVNAASIRGNNISTTAPGSGEVLAWNGSAWAPASLTSGFSGTLPVGNGGTGATSLTDNRLLVGNGTAAIGVLAAGTAGQLLQSGGAADPAWSTATFPTGAATQYDFLYASAANTWASFPTANTGVLVTSGAGAPSWASGAVANRVLRTDGTTISFGQVDPTNDIAQGTGAVTIQSANAGTSTFGNNSGAATTSVRSGTGGTTITSSGTSATAISITATGAGGGITLTPTPSGLNGHTVISAGRLGIGSSSPAYTLDVVGSAQFTSNVHAQAFFYTSDARLKENFMPSPGLEAISKLGGYRFNWKKDHSPEIGLIAQEVEQVFPELVTTNANGYKSVKYGNLVAPLIEATKELYGMCKATDSQMRAIASIVERNQVANDARMGQLEKEVSELREQNEILRREIEAIKKKLAP